MRRLRLYLDTTVWNFAFADDAPDHRAETLEFFAKVRLGLFEVYTSDVVLKELLDAPQPRREQVMALSDVMGPRLLESSPEIERLASIYVAKGVMPQRSMADSLHIAHATVHEMDYLLSWNFRHLANPNRRWKVAALNAEEGYRFPMTIATPLEVLYVE